ncbi:hypothetical protein D3C80_2124040 [compost metagenome]
MTPAKIGRPPMMMSDSRASTANMNAAMKIKFKISRMKLIIPFDKTSDTEFT